MADSLEGMAKTKEGWPLVDQRRVCTDSYKNDDCWHRGPYTIFTLRGTNITEEEKIGDGVGDLFDRFMTRVKAAGYIGNMEFLNADRPPPYRILHSNASPEPPTEAD